MVDPDRGVDQDHVALSRPPGAAAASLPEPPRAARRLAFSTRIKASSPSRSSADLSVMPVSSVARASSSSSMVSEVTQVCGPIRRMVITGTLTSLPLLFFSVSSGP